LSCYSSHFFISHSALAGSSEIFRYINDKPTAAEKGMIWSLGSSIFEVSSTPGCPHCLKSYFSLYHPGSVPGFE